MKYWDKALIDLEGSDRSFKAIYETIFSFEENVFYEETRDNSTIKTSYKECRNYIEIMAGNLKKELHGHEENSYVAIMMENCGEWIISFWAILMSGFIPILVNTKINGNINEELMSSAKIVAIISKEPFKHFKHLHPENLLIETEKTVSIWADQIILCTSGTSGTPKMCVFEGAAISSQILNSKYVLKKNPTIKYNREGEVRLLTFLPFYHIFGLVANLLWFSFFGRTFVFLSDYSPETILNTCRSQRITHIFAIPLLWNSIAETVKKRALNKGEKYFKKLQKGINISLRLQNVFPVIGRKIASALFFKNVRRQIFGKTADFCISGGSYIKEETLRIINGLGYPLYNGYGMTEIGISSVELGLKSKFRISGSIGKAFPSFIYKIVEDELWVSGDSLFSGYLEGDNNIKLKEEWFKTGDYAYFDKKGNLFILGRTDDLIINSDGENLSPDFLESVFELETTNRYCILGLKSDFDNYDISLVVESEDGSSFKLNKTLIRINEINNLLPLGQKVQRCFISNEPLPTAIETKVKRKELKNMIENGTFSGKEIILNDYANREKVIAIEELNVLSFVKLAMAEVLEINVEKINDDSHFITDLHGNSFSYFALISTLEKEYGVTFNLTRETLCAMPTDFARYISNS